MRRHCCVQLPKSENHWKYCWHCPQTWPAAGPGNHKFQGNRIWPQQHFWDRELELSGTLDWASAGGNIRGSARTLEPLDSSEHWPWRMDCVSVGCFVLPVVTEPPLVKMCFVSWQLQKRDRSSLFLEPVVPFVLTSVKKRTNQCLESYMQVPDWHPIHRSSELVAMDWETPVWNWREERNTWFFSFCNKSYIQSLEAIFIDALKHSASFGGSTDVHFQLNTLSSQLCSLHVNAETPHTCSCRRAPWTLWQMDCDQSSAE